MLTPFSFIKSSSFNPATLSLTVWWRAAYASSPWVGVASAGGSGSRDGTEATNPPSTGATLNGRSPAVFDGTNDRLANATAMSTLAPTAAYFYWVLFYVDSIGTNNALAAAYNNDALWSDTGGYIGASLTTSGGNKVQAWQYDGATKGNEHAISLSAWNLLCVRYDGTDVRSKLNSGSVSTAASGAYDDATGTLQLGQGGAAFANVRIADIGMMASAGSDARFDDIRSYVNSYHGLSL